MPFVILSHHYSETQVEHFYVNIDNIAGFIRHSKIDFTKVYLIHEVHSRSVLDVVEDPAKIEDLIHRSIVAGTQTRLD